MEKKAELKETTDERKPLTRETTNESELYDVSMDNKYVVRVKIPNQPKVLLIHTLRPPTKNELRQHSQMQFEIRKGRRLKTRVMEANEWLYDHIVLSTSGYSNQGIPITAETPEWRNLIPANHKTNVISEILDMDVEDDEGESENF